MVGESGKVNRKVTITPESLAQSGSESAHQIALFCWASQPEQRALYPELELMFHIPNGGERNRAVAGKLKAEGVKAGVLDIMLPVARQGWHGMFIELKKKPNVASPAQLDFATKVSVQGYYTCLCYSWGEAAIRIQDYLECTAIPYLL